jgi:hypothetical protein
MLIVSVLAEISKTFTKSPPSLALASAVLDFHLGIPAGGEGSSFASLNV